ncbi:hypothetical protein [Sorangium sp. So ce117]|uniref:hypothetical protein n=1 Tax=Sorangium sp. So ce117 TaxID=3133277 RepID=UPI003F5E9848
MLFGFMLFVFGLNGFLGFIPPPGVPERAAAFLDALTAMGYMVPLIKRVEVAAGALLLANRFVPLALVLKATSRLSSQRSHRGRTNPRQSSPQSR